MSSSSPARPAAPQAGRKGRRAPILVLTRIAVAVSSAAVLAAVPTLSASAASTRPASAATAASSSAAQAAPDGSTWVLVYGWYPTQSACREVGIKDYDIPYAISFKCVEINRGDYFTWALYIFLVD
jgi:hypothetical protein